MDSPQPNPSNLQSHFYSSDNSYLSGLLECNQTRSVCYSYLDGSAIRSSLNSWLFILTSEFEISRRYATSQVGLRVPSPGNNPTGEPNCRFVIKFHEIFIGVRESSGMVERIDAFAHALPERFLEEMAEIHPTSELMDMEDATHMWDIDHRLSDMDEFGIDRQCIMLSRSTIWQGMDTDEMLPLVELANDTMRELADESERLIPVATIPAASDDLIAEFRRCIEDLGMAGAQIFSNVDGSPIDGPDFRELYTVAEELDAPLWLHPQLHEWYDWTDEYGNDKIFGWLFDTSLALGRLVFSGVMQDHPDLKIIPHHMGAMVPFFHKRIKTFTQAYSHLDYAETDEPMIEHFKRFYPDTGVNGSVAALECGLDFFGPEQVLFGTDYPFGPKQGRVWMRETVRSVDEVKLDDADRNAVLHENIEHLIA